MRQLTKEEVMELLMKRIGVVEDEEFEAQFAHEECQVNKFCNGELLTKVNEEWRDNSMWAVFVKYFDVYEFKVIPFKPKIGDKYWWVEVDGKVCSDISERGCTFDCMAMAIGNCFRTKESALAHKEEILKILIINLSSNLTYDILFSHLPSRKHYCHYCNHYIQHHNSIQNQIRNISSIM